jgi:hypothetical protein
MKRALAMNVAILACASTLAAEPATKTTPTGMLVDAVGKKIGQFYLNPSNASVGLAHAYLNGRATFFGVIYLQDGSGKFAPNGVPEDNKVYYEGANCTGAAYVTNGIFSPTQTGPGMSAQVYIGNGGQVFVTPQSYRPSKDSCSVANGNPMQLAPLLDVVELGTVFTPPYTLR